MTIHASKGLEFPFVHIVGVEENLFPSQRSLNSRDDLEEERRLFYVALTRAEKNIYISYATSRYQWGNLNNCEPRRFIDELDTQYLDLDFRPKSNSSDSSFFENEYSSSQPLDTFSKPKPQPIRQTTTPLLPK